MTNRLYLKMGKMLLEKGPTHILTFFIEKKFDAHSLLISSSVAIALQIR